MLFAADLDVTHGRHLEQFETAVGGVEAALVAQGLHFSGGWRLEIHSDSQILIENLHGVYAADRGGYWQAHGIAECLFRSDYAVERLVAVKPGTTKSERS
jgi:hypothetical protein